MKNFIMRNEWKIITFIVGSIVAFSLLSVRVDALEKKVINYPSQDWFELKFQTIDKSIQELKNK